MEEVDVAVLFPVVQPQSTTAGWTVRETTQRVTIAMGESLMAAVVNEFGREGRRSGILWVEEG